MEHLSVSSVSYRWGGGNQSKNILYTVYKKPKGRSKLNIDTLDASRANRDNPEF